MVPEEVEADVEVVEVVDVGTVVDRVSHLPVEIPVIELFHPVGHPVVVSCRLTCRQIGRRRIAGQAEKPFTHKRYANTGDVWQNHWA